MQAFTSPDCFCGVFFVKDFYICVNENIYFFLRGRMLIFHPQCGLFWLSDPSYFLGCKLCFQAEFCSISKQTFFAQIPLSIMHKIHPPTLLQNEFQVIPSQWWFLVALSVHVDILFAKSQNSFIQQPFSQWWWFWHSWSAIIESFWQSFCHFVWISP